MHYFYPHIHCGTEIMHLCKNVVFFPFIRKEVLFSALPWSAGRKLTPEKKPSFFVREIIG